MRGWIINGVLGLAVIASALGLVYAKHEHRAKFVALQELERQRDHLNVEWGKLQLEQSTWGTHGRIEREARKRLKMETPQFEDIVVIKR